MPKVRRLRDDSLVSVQSGHRLSFYTYWAEYGERNVGLHVGVSRAPLYAVQALSVGGVVSRRLRVVDARTLRLRGMVGPFDTREHAVRFVRQFRGIEAVDFASRCVSAAHLVGARVYFVRDA